MLFILLTIFIISAILFVISWQHRHSGWGVVGSILFAGIVLAILIKVVYEELIPCVFIDPKYCSFWNTQYWNLFNLDF